MTRILLLLVILAGGAMLTRAQPTNSILEIKLIISTEGVRSLAQEPRKPVSLEVKYAGRSITNATVHLKGKGSFQPISQKPSFSISSSEKNLFGRKKLLLNNSSQDRSFLRWKIASELFLRANIPAAEINFAKVTLNGQYLGLYLTLEPTDKTFLKKHFGSDSVNLYEGGNNDGNDHLEQDNGDSDHAQKDLQLLARACQETKLPERWKQLNNVLDVDRFLTFMAVEVLVGHADGYSMDRNNFRIYHDPKSRRFVFIPHGLDLLFHHPNLPLEPRPNGLVAQAVYQTPQGKAAYDERVRSLGRDFYSGTRLLDRIDELSHLIQGYIGAEEQGSIQDLRRNITSRGRFILNAAGRE
jgi:spore coat protein H